MVLTVGSLAILKNTNHLTVYGGRLLLAQNGKFLQSGCTVTSRIYLLSLSTFLDRILVGEKHFERARTFRPVRPSQEQASSSFPFACSTVITATQNTAGLLLNNLNMWRCRTAYYRRGWDPSSCAVTT